MKFVSFMKKGGFIAAVLVLFIVLDTALAASGFMQKSGLFWQDDFEITRRHHPEKYWERVIFGSSELVSGYREDLSEANYVNLGMDYGVLTDLVQLLENGHIEVSSDLVLALNWCALCDVLDTNPTYEWHRKWYEPYVWFQRDRLSGLIRDEWSALLGDGEHRARVWLTQDKAYYYGMMTPEELAERQELLQERFFSGGTEWYAENLTALDKIAAFCEKNGIRLRCLWLPENPAAPLGDTNTAVRELARERCAALGLEFYDMTDALHADCFYDTGHMSYERGAVIFTEVLDKWLLS